MLSTPSTQNVNYDFLNVRQIINLFRINLLKTSPEYTRTRAGVYRKCMLQPNQIVFNGLKPMDSFGMR